METQEKYIERIKKAAEKRRATCALKRAVALAAGWEPAKRPRFRLTPEAMEARQKEMSEKRKATWERKRAAQPMNPARNLWLPPIRMIAEFPRVEFRHETFRRARVLDPNRISAALALDPRAANALWKYMVVPQYMGNGARDYCPITSFRWYTEAEFKEAARPFPSLAGVGFPRRGNAKPWKAPPPLPEW